MGVGFGIGPNGQFGPVYTIDPPSYSPPSEYDYRFETDDGVIINVNVETDNAARAETVRRQCEDLGWNGRPLEDADSPPSGPVGIFFSALGIAALVAFCAGLAIAFGFILADIGDFIQLQDWRVGFISSRMGIGIGVMAAIAYAVDAVNRLQAHRKSAKAGIER